MTTDTDTRPDEYEAPEAPPEPLMAQEVREEAQTLIRTLAAAAGNEGEVYERLRRYLRNKPTESALGGLAAAVVLIFAECITEPVEPGEYGPMTYPTD